MNALSPASRPLRSIYGSIRESMDRAEALLREETRAPDPLVGELVGRAPVLEGKRIRPGLVLLSARVCGGIRDAHVGLAVVVELIHNATLVHDDVLDGADRRRHRRTLNADWGNAAPVLVGDFLFARAFGLCARLDVREANLLLSRTTQEMCLGEITQTLLRRRLDLSEETYLGIIRRKTASLFGAAARLGALGQQEPLPAGALETFGVELGTAFQIVDDCLDLAGEEAVAGKSLGTDLALGKMTLPLIALRARLPAPRRVEFDRLLLSPDGQPEKRPLLRGWSEEFGAERYALERARRHLDAAEGALKPFGARPGVEDLAALAAFVLDRPF